MLSNKLYDALKYVALIGLPALATLYNILAEIWGLPYGVEITATITAVATALGTLLQISSAKYKEEEGE